MRLMFPRALPQPLFLLLLIPGLFTFLVQSGELGTSDTTHRLQVAHSLWTDEPQVFPNEYPEFGVHGRGGRLFASYGIGQSLLMLPADVVSTAASRLPFWRSYVDSGVDPAIRSILVSVSTNVLLNVLTAFAAYSLLGLLGFGERESVAGALGLLIATTHLHYAQNMTENNYIFLLTISGFALQYRWLVSGDRRWLLWGSVALGLNLLTRITTAIDIVGAGSFLVLVLVFARKDAAFTREGSRIGAERLPFKDTAVIYLRTALPVYAIFFLLDRVYQYLRFGSWTDTYVTILSREQRMMNPSLPASFPFDGHWFQGGVSSGLLGPLFAPDKSIFLFDPLFPLTVFLAFLLWRRMVSNVKAFFVASIVLVLGYIALYGRYDSWAGDFAWGDRYVSSAVEMASLLAVPLLLRYWGSLNRSIRSLALASIAVSFAVQVASLTFWLPLEIYQMETFGPHAWVVPLRFKNIAASVLGRREAWGLNAPAIYRDPWDAAHLTTWNFLPSLLRHIGVAPLWVVHAAYGVWLVVAVALTIACVRLARLLLRPLAGKQS
jgi:hypothetical protein